MLACLKVVLGVRSFGRAASVEAVEAYIKTCRIVLIVSD